MVTLWFIKDGKITAEPGLLKFSISISFPSKSFKFRSLSLFISLSNNYASEEDLKEIDMRVKTKVLECEKFAEESSYPEKNVMYDSVYEQTDYPFLKHKI